jgi:hypothetical protein
MKNIKIDVQLKECWLWKNPIKLKWWLDILFSINDIDTTVFVSNKEVVCPKGSVIRSLDAWAKDWDVTRKVVRAFLLSLEKSNLIIYENIKIGIKITLINNICNNTIKKTKEPTNKTIQDTTLDYKNIRPETWDKWIQYKKNQFRQTYKDKSAEQIALNELIKHSNNIDSIAYEIINISKTNLWKGLFPLNKKTDIKLGEVNTSPTRLKFR